MTDRIRAEVWLGPGLGFAIRTLSTPELGPGQTLIRIESACICGSDLHTVAGRRESPAPSVLGHEYCGVVEALGPGPAPRTTLGEAVQVGDRVVWSITDSCGQCTRCAQGLPKSAGIWPSTGTRHGTAGRFPAVSPAMRSYGPEPR